MMKILEFVKFGLVTVVTFATCRKGLFDSAIPVEPVWGPRMRLCLIRTWAEFSKVNSSSNSNDTAFHFSTITIRTHQDVIPGVYYHKSRMVSE